jgi:hypothetical protein
MQRLLRGHTRRQWGGLGQHPAAIASQNGRLSERCNTGGRPGDLIFARPARSDRRFAVTIHTSYREVLQRRVESTSRWGERLAQGYAEATYSADASTKI